MHGVRMTFYQTCRKLHKLSCDSPSDTLKRKAAELEKKRKRRHPNKDDLYVDVPESRAWLDTATMPMILTAVGTALFAKILMMLDEANAQERLEKKIKDAPEGQGTVRMLTREEWEKIREVRPRTPFESTIARPNGKIRTGEPLHVEDVKDWTLDVFTNALTRAEETAKHGSI
ncbi:cytoplasmic dynein 2 light intermediate chain [Perilla frutescens var. hirtella]|uniref:Cytoplasmic dynein 2 light intermediate chain n=1 Tax=Perilla frutescens var. hirtella TaxID=608512 RepID=A0AAD4IQF2_PERFH|nr:cytoplasmic dynein 2 light intermediate chain [Perilla frutescens var. hirtella]